MSSRQHSEAIANTLKLLNSDIVRNLRIVGIHLEEPGLSQRATYLSKLEKGRVAWRRESECTLVSSDIPAALGLPNAKSGDALLRDKFTIEGMKKKKTPVLGDLNEALKAYATVSFDLIDYYCYRRYALYYRKFLQ